MLPPKDAFYLLHLSPAFSSGRSLHHIRTNHALLLRTCQQQVWLMQARNQGEKNSRLKSMVRLRHCRFYIPIKNERNVRALCGIVCENSLMLECWRKKPPCANAASAVQSDSALSTTLSE